LHIEVDMEGLFLSILFRALRHKKTRKTGGNPPIFTRFREQLILLRIHSVLLRNNWVFQ